MKKIFLFAGVGVLSFVLFAGSARASVLDDLLRQANQLQEVVARLRAQIEAQRTTQPSVIVAPTIATQATTGSGGALGFVTLDELPGSPRASCEMPALSRGSRGNSVYLLQMYLKQNGNYPEGLITGFYGSLTEKAVRSFSISQRDDSINQRIEDAITKDLGRYFPECSGQSETRNVVSDDFVSVTSPYAGQFVRIGDVLEIKWLAKNDSSPHAYFDIEFGADRVPAAFQATGSNIIAQNVYCLGETCSYKWTVLEKFLGFENPIIVVRDKKSGISGRSKAFRIDSGSVSTAKSIGVISPNGGEILKAGETRTIQWNATNIDKVAIEVCYSAGCSQIAPAVQASLGKYQWYIDPNALYIPGSTFRIRISESGAKELKWGEWDESDRVFTITTTSSVSTPTITITSNPRADSAGNVTIKQGDKITITGVPSNLSGKMLADYTRSFFFDSGFYPDCSNTDWVMTCTSSQIGTSNFYITIYKDGQIYQSNLIKVTVVASTPTFTFAYPAGGEGFLSDATYTVKWSTNSTASTVRLLLYKGGILVTTNTFGSNPFADVPNTGSYNWLIPKTLADGNDYSLRIFDPSDLSDLFSRRMIESVKFSIQAGYYVTPVGSPKPKSILFAGQVYSMNWSGGINQYGDIYLVGHKAGKHDVLKVASSVSLKEGLFNWTVPASSELGKEAFTIEFRDSSGRYAEMGKYFSVFKDGDADGDGLVNCVDKAIVDSSDGSLISISDAMRLRDTTYLVMSCPVSSGASSGTSSYFASILGAMQAQLDRAAEILKGLSERVGR